MKLTFLLNSIGTIHAKYGNFYLHIDKEYIPCLKGLEGFSHVAVRVYISWGLLYNNTCEGYLCKVQRIM